MRLTLIDGNLANRMPTIIINGIKRDGTVGRVGIAPSPSRITIAIVEVNEEFKF